MRIKTKVGKIAMAIDIIVFWFFIKVLTDFLSSETDITFYINPAITITTIILFLLNTLIVFFIIVGLEKLKENNNAWKKFIKILSSFVLILFSVTIISIIYLSINPFPKRETNSVKNDAVPLLKSVTTCAAYQSGYAFNTKTKICEFTGHNGCSGSYYNKLSTCQLIEEKIKFWQRF